MYNLRYQLAPTSSTSVQYQSFPSIGKLVDFMDNINVYPAAITNEEGRYHACLVNNQTGEVQENPRVIHMAHTVGHWTRFSAHRKTMLERGIDEMLRQSAHGTSMHTLCLSKSFEAALNKHHFENKNPIMAD